MAGEDKRRRRSKRQSKRRSEATSSAPPWTTTFTVPVIDGAPAFGADAVTDDDSLRAIAEETATEGRALLSDHPAVRLGARIHDPRINMSVFSPDPGDDDGATEALPVMLFEPRRMLAGTDPDTGESTELQVEMIVSRGFKRWPPISHALEPATGWSIGRAGGGIELRDDGAGLWARAETTPEPQWLSAAASQRWVLAVYGPKLGVRVPPGLGPAAYTDQQRRDELREAREYGLVAAALARWAG